MLGNFRLIAAASIALGLVFFINPAFTQVVAQQAPDYRWSLGLSSGASRSRVTDQAFSRLEFAGYNPVFGIMAKSKGKIVEHELNISFSNGTMEMEGKSDFDVDQVTLSVDYSPLFEIVRTDNNSFLLQAGPGIQLFYADRKYNNFINRNHSYENLASLGLAAKFSYHFSGSLSGLTIVDNLFVPFVSGYSDETTGNEAGEVGLSIRKSSLDNMFRYQDVVSFPDVFSIRNTIAIQKNLSLRHIIGLMYCWQYYDVKNNYATRLVNHQLSITYHYNF